MQILFMNLLECLNEIRGARVSFESPGEYFASFSSVWYSSRSHREARVRKERSGLEELDLYVRKGRIMFVKKARQLAFTFSRTLSRLQRRGFMR